MQPNCYFTFLYVRGHFKTPQKSTKCATFVALGVAWSWEKCNAFVSEKLLFFLHLLKIQPFICFHSILSTYIFYAFKRNATKERQRANL